MKALITLALMLPLAANALDYWTPRTINGDDPDASGFMVDPEVSRFITQPGKWCHYEANPVLAGLPDFYVAMYPWGQTVCEGGTTRPLEAWTITALMNQDRQTLVAEGCPDHQPTSVFLVEMRGATNGLHSIHFLDHVAFRMGMEAEKLESVVPHELMHSMIDKVLFGGAVGDRWWSEAIPTAAEILLHPQNDSVIFAHAPWSNMTWGLGNSANPHGRYQLGFFLSWLENLDMRQDNGYVMCRWIAGYPQELILDGHVDDWETLAKSIGSPSSNIGLLRTRWSHFVGHWNTGISTHMPLVESLPAPGITVCPANVGQNPPAVCNLSGLMEGQTFQIEIPADGQLDIQWWESERCGSEPFFYSYATITALDGTVLDQFTGGSLLHTVRQGLPPGPAYITVASLEGNLFLRQFFVESHLGFIVATAIGDQYDMVDHPTLGDPYPYVDEPRSRECIHP